MKVAIIGAGNMGGAIARGLVRGSVVRSEEIVVSNPSRPKLERLQADCPGLTVTTDNREAAQGAEWIVLAVKPWLVEAVLNELRPTPGQLILSVAAGITFARLSAILGREGQPMFRLIPNTAIAQMQSTTLIASHACTPGQEELVLRVFNEMGLAMLLPEAKMGAATAMTSCGIAYALKYIQAVTQAGIELGISPKEGQRMVAQSVKGAAELLLQNDTHPAVEIDKVCTPGGLTIKGINALERHGFTHALLEAVRMSNQ